MPRRLLLVLVAVLLAGPPALACSICKFSLQSQTLRQDAAQAKIVLYGTLTESALNPDGVGGTTKFAIDQVLKADPILDGRKGLDIPRFVPLDPKNPPR